MNGEEVFHDEWCPLNGSRCGNCGPCAQMPECPNPVPSEVAEITAGEREVEAAEGCGATRGYCACDRPKDGHRHHHCPECATHPNGGWAFSTWVDNPKIRPQDRAHESMHEYATGDPWASALAEPDAVEVEAPGVYGLPGSDYSASRYDADVDTLVRVLRGTATDVDRARAVLASDWLAAHDDRVRREEGAKVLREAAADIRLGLDTSNQIGRGVEFACQQLDARAASVGRGEGL